MGQETINTICNVLLVGLAAIGLWTWRMDLRVSARLDSTEKARRIYIAAQRLVKEVLLIREGRQTDSEVRKGVATLDEKLRHRPQEPGFYVQALDSLMTDLWDANDEALLAIEKPFTKEVADLVAMARHFQTEYQKYHGTSAVGPSVIFLDTYVPKEVKEMSSIVTAPESLPDEFADLLLTKRKALVTELTPYIKMDGKHRG